MNPNGRKLSDEAVAHLTALEAAATPGPWDADSNAVCEARRDN